MARWHNETVNIWSHLSAAIIFSWLLIRFLAQSGALTLDVVAVVTYFLGAIVSFALSFVHHLLSNVNRSYCDYHDSPATYAGMESRNANCEDEFFFFNFPEDSE